MDSTVALAALALATTVVAGMFKLLSKLSQSIDANTKSNKKIAEATERGSREAKQRNGHLAELVVQSNDMFKQVASHATAEIITAVQTVDKQVVGEQVVSHAVIKEKI